MGYKEDLKMDTRQMLSMIGADDVSTFLPNFGSDAFLPGLEGSGGSDLPAWDGGFLPGNGNNDNDWNNVDSNEEEESEDDSEEDSEEEEEDGTTNNNNNDGSFPEDFLGENEEEEEEENEPVDISRPSEPIDGDVVVLQASELVNSESSSSSRISTAAAGAAATGIVSIATIAMLL